MGLLGWMLFYAVFLWWVSTGVILFLNHLPQATFRYSVAACSAVLAGALCAVRLTAHTASVQGAYVAFTAALLAWGWQEMTFFMGVITGPRRSAEAAAFGWRRFIQAAQTCLYHEAAITIVGVAIALLAAGGTNQVAVWTYTALWAMRLSAKFNVFLGVRNLNEQFLPRRLTYLQAYMRRRPFNALLPVSLLGGAAAALWFAARAFAPGVDAFQAVGAGFVSVILLLGVLEHAFLVLPLPFAALWTGFSSSCPVAKDSPALHFRRGRRTSKGGAASASALIPALPNAIERS